MQPFFTSPAFPSFGNDIYETLERYKKALELIETGDCVPWDVAAEALRD